MRYLPALALLLFSGCEWGLLNDRAADNVIRYERAKQTKLDAECLAAFITATPPKDVPARPAEVDLWDEWRDEVALWEQDWKKWEANALWILEQLQRRCVDEAERANARIVGDGGTPPAKINPDSREAFDNKCRLKARAGKVEAKEHFFNTELPERVQRGAQHVGGFFWNLLPWWAQLGIILLFGYVVVLTGLYLRKRYQAACAKIEAEQKKREVEEHAKQLAETDKERSLYQAAARELDRWIEANIPEDLRKTLVKLPNARQAHAVINDEFKRDQAKWVANMMGDAMLTPEELQRLKDHVAQLHRDLEIQRANSITNDLPNSDPPASS